MASELLLVSLRSAGLLPKLAALSNLMPLQADRPHRTSTSTAQLAAELLQALEQGSAVTLIDLLNHIIHTEVPGLPDAGAVSNTCQQEQWDVLRGVAIKLRLDLHAVLLHLYQRMEASRTYVALLEHLAGNHRAASSGEASHAQAPSAHPQAAVLAWPPRLVEASSLAPEELAAAFPLPRWPSAARHRFDARQNLAACPEDLCGVGIPADEVEAL